MRAAPRVPSAIVDFARLKAEVARLYPPGHPLREVLSGELEQQGWEEGLAKVELLVRLVFATRTHRRP